MAAKEPIEQIRQRAYAIWEEEGRPSGRDIEHWLKAEREVTASNPGPASKLKPKGPESQTAASARRSKSKRAKR